MGKMKDHIVKTWKRPDASYDDTFTTYENLDKKLKAEIAEFKLTENTVEIGWPSKTWTIEGKEGSEYKLVNGKNVQYIPEKELRESLATKLEYARNIKYKAGNYFKNVFGIISNLDMPNSKNKNYAQLEIIDLQGINDFLGRAVGAIKPVEDIDTMSVQGYETFYSYKMSGYKGIGLEMSPGGRMLNLHFTPEGDFINRNYNENFDDFERKEISPVVFLEIFKKAFLDEFKNVEHFEYSSGKYFTNKVCVIPYAKKSEVGHIGFDIVPVRYDGKSYQHNSGDTIYKKGSKVELRTPLEAFDDLMSQLKPIEKCLLSDDFKNFMNYVPKNKTEEVEI